MFWLISFIEFPYPAAFVLLALLPLAWWLTRRQSAAIVKQRLPIRLAILGLAALAATGVSLRLETHDKWVVFAVDESRSVGGIENAQVQEYLKRLSEQHASDNYSVETFGSDVETDLAEAIALVTKAPPGYVPDLVVLTDGNATHGDALRAAAGMSVPVSVEPLAGITSPEVAVVDLHAPANAFPFELLSLRATVTSNHDDRVLLTLYRNDQVVEQREVPVTAGSHDFYFATQNGAAARNAWKVIATEAQDTLVENNQRTAVVLPPPAPSVLIVNRDQDGAAALAQVHRQGGFKVSLTAQVPRDAQALQSYDAVLLTDTVPNELDDAQSEALNHYVHIDGGGLIMMGDQAFTNRAFAASPLEEIMPVAALPPADDAPTLAMVLVIDQSTSMREENRMSLAKEAARRSVQLLNARDKVGVLTFGSESKWISDIATRSDLPLLLRRIDQIQASGNTRMFPALQRAYLALSQTEADRRHIVLLTDGVAAPGDFAEVAAEFAAARITVSTISISDGAEQMILQDISRTADGRHYHCVDAADVPRVLVEETLAAVGSADVKFTPAPLKQLPGLEIASAPPLATMTPTTSKPNAQVLLTGLAGAPLLSWRTHGAGITMALPSEISHNAWRDWSGFAAFCSRVTRHAMRKPIPPRLQVDVRRYGGKATVTIDALRPNNRFWNAASIAVFLSTREDERRALTVTQVAPGRYESTFSAPSPGDYELAIRLNDSTDSRYFRQRVVTVDYEDELAIRPANETALRQLAEHTGGRYQASLVETFAADGRTATRVYSLWQYLLIIAALCYVGELAARRYWMRR